MQAAIATLGNDDPAVGYSVAYPFGVAGPILFLYLTFLFLKPKMEMPASPGLELLEITLRRSEYFGKPLSELMSALPVEMQIVALRRDFRNQPASPDIVLAENDVVLAVAPAKAMLEEARNSSAKPRMARSPRNRRDLDYLRVFASRAAVVGRGLGELNLPGDNASVVVQVRRGDADLLPRPDLVLHAA